MLGRRTALLVRGLWRGMRKTGLVRIEGPQRPLSTTSALCGLNEFQKQKILGEFNTLYDRNKDGFVDAKDIENYDKVLHEYYSRTQGQYLRDSMSGYNDYWALFKELADVNNDGKLSQEEWIDIWTKISDSSRDQSFKSLPQWVKFMPRVIFPIMDYKGDGLLDEDEYKNFWYEVGGIGSDHTLITKCMDTMTENGEHQLDLKRFETLYADFYLSTSPTSPGRYMAGPIEHENDIA